MEEEIGKDNSNNRVDKVKERQDHFMAQQVDQNERVGDPREENVIVPENVDEEMSGADEEELTDAPATKSDVRLKSPERKKATKRSTARHEEEPSTTRITFEDTAMEENDGIDVDSVAAKKEYQLMLYHAILGHDLTETYSHARLTLAGNRHVIGQLMGVDMRAM